MEYKINIVCGKPNWDAFPTAKLSEPLWSTEQGIFSQAVLCAEREKGILAKLWAFETAPRTGSGFDDGSVLSLMLGNNGYLAASLRPDGSARFEYISDNGVHQDLSWDKLDVKPFSGEDLQGEYWGAELFLSTEMLKLAGIDSLSAGSPIKGNILHCSDMPWGREYMALHNIDTKEPTLYAPQCFGNFVLIDY